MFRGNTLTNLSPESANMIEDADLRAALIRFREDRILAKSPNDIASRKHSILRRSMIDHLVAFKPTSAEEWIADMPVHLMRETEPEQMRLYGRAIIELVRRHLRLQGRLPQPDLPYMCVDNEPPRPKRKPN